MEDLDPGVQQAQVRQDHRNNVAQQSETCTLRKEVLTAVLPPTSAESRGSTGDTKGSSADTRAEVVGLLLNKCIGFTSWGLSHTWGLPGNV